MSRKWLDGVNECRRKGHEHSDLNLSHEWTGQRKAAGDWLGVQLSSERQRTLASQTLSAGGRLLFGWAVCVEMKHEL